MSSEQGGEHHWAHMDRGKRQAASQRKPELLLPASCRKVEGGGQEATLHTEGLLAEDRQGRREVKKLDPSPEPWGAVLGKAGIPS